MAEFVHNALSSQGMESKVTVTESAFYKGVLLNRIQKQLEEALITNASYAVKNWLHRLKN